MNVESGKDAGMQEDFTELYENDIELYLKEYEKEKEVSCYDINQMRWNAVLLYIYRFVFKPGNPKNKRNKYNSNINYNDVNLINNICDIYINMCYEHNKEISIAGFSKLTGIAQDTIYAWAKGDTRGYIYYTMDGEKIDNINAYKLNYPNAAYKQELGSSYSDIYKKLSNERETCLTSMTLQGNIGALAKGKIERGWVEGQLLIRAEDTLSSGRTPEQIAADYVKVPGMIDDIKPDF